MNPNQTGDSDGAVAQSVPGPILLVDGKNCAYRAIYANQTPYGPVKYHSLIVMLRFINTWVEKHKPSSVHVFWDAPRHAVWRRRVYEEYKDRQEPELHDERNIKDELVATQNAAKELFQFMNVRQYERKHQEADDLIYAACQTVYPRPTIIVSSDSDFLQIPFSMQNVKLYEPKHHKFFDVPEYNPAVAKALMGDNADCVDGYEQIGPKRSARIAESAEKVQSFLVERGKSPFYRNLLLIDLSLCPDLLANRVYVMKGLVKPIVFDKTEIFKIANAHKVNGLIQEYDKIVLPFKKLGKQTS